MLRLDQALVDLKLCDSREKAKRAILAGTVLINGQKAHKASDSVPPEARVELTQAEKYVSRGGFKLEHALTHFAVSPSRQRAIDIGASTGGFTDCLLQNGAVTVYAVDVGKGQLAWKLRKDPRIVVMESTNARHLRPESFKAPYEPVDLITADCSFISLKKILPPAVPLLRTGGKIIALIKPQFEAGKAEADKGRGVITDSAIHDRVIEELREFVVKYEGLNWVGVTESPLIGPAGNKEFLALIEKTN